jgi:DNA-binding NarL/FixJ family response regulator
MSQNIKTLLVDDHTLVREALASKLGRSEGIEIIGQADQADQAVSIAREKAPDVVVMDIDMPGLDCFEAARRIKEQRHATKIIFLSAHLHDSYIDRALEVEASGYMTKRESNEVLLDAIQRVAGGGLFFSNEVKERLIIDVDKVRVAQRPHSRIASLTVREREILRYIAQGNSKKEIASNLNLSVKTVETHSSNLMSKLGIHDRVELARFAIREGLAEP